jgi:protein-S-isoprenylcysteine O-methyltransferase Ste14
VLELLARLRTRLGLVFGVAALFLAQPTLRTIAAGAAIAAIGEALRLWAAGHLNKSREVTVSGPYRWFAHPLYVGSSIMGAGLALASASVLVTILIALYLGVTIIAAVRTEEAFLRSHFGNDYRRYRSGAATGSPRRFSLARAFANGEHRTVAGLVAAVLLLVLKATYNVLFWRAAGR